MRRIYLAGPEVFLAGAASIGETKKALCARYGFEGVYPIDPDVSPAAANDRATALQIGRKNEDLIRACQIVIANLTPFRGPSADVGTVYEMGLARGLGLVVCGYTNVAVKFSDRTRVFLGDQLRSSGDGRVEDADRMGIEDWGMADNLMIESSIEESGGVLVVGEARRAELFTWLGGFEKVLIDLRRREMASR